MTAAELLPKTTAPATKFRLGVTRRTAYDVIDVAGPTLALDDDTLAEAFEGRPVFIVVDRNVDRVHGTALRRYAAAKLDTAGISILVADEATKTLESVAAICTAAHRAKLPRNGIIVGVGGGVALDQIGCAAALFRRGTRYARIPTTLTGIVDVCCGIKQGVNANGAKNLLGAFYPAFTNVCDLSFLASSPQRTIACGLAEIVKIALVCDGDLFELLESHGAALLASHFQNAPIAATVVARAQAGMIDQLSDNLYEDDLARFVDFGHTFSPSLETRTNYELGHGEAVAIDMVLSTAIAVELGLCEHRVLDRIVALLRTLRLPATSTELTEDLVVSAIACVRAHRGGSLNLVVPTSIGRVRFVQDVALRALHGAFARILAATA